MRPKADALRFWMTFAALTAVLGWAFWTVSIMDGRYSLQLNMLAVPVVSAMLASIGFGWRRKLVYGGLTVGLYVLTGFTAELAGLHDLVRQQTAAGAAFPSLLVVIYMGWLVTFPFAMLVLFAGRKPSLLWSRDVR